MKEENTKAYKTNIYNMQITLRHMVEMGGVSFISTPLGVRLMRNAMYDL